MNLRQSEGFIEYDGKTIDITDLETSEDDPEGQINHIKIFALNRIYEQMHSKYTETT